MHNCWVPKRRAPRILAAQTAAHSKPSSAFEEHSDEYDQGRSRELDVNRSLIYEDHGSGSPVVLIDGWPLSGASWEKQTAALLAAGHRVITYDRRGFGRSSKPATGYDYDTFAADLAAVLDALSLDKVDLVGFSMGTGEVTRYLGKYGSKQVRRAVLIGTLGPSLVKTTDNPEGVDPGVFKAIKDALRRDRPAFLLQFLHDFYNWDVLGGKLVSERVVEDNWNVGAGASAIGTLACVDAWTRTSGETSRRTTCRR